MTAINSGRVKAINASIWPIWRDLAQLAAEALAIGVVFSVLLALAVFVLAKNTRGDEFAAAPVPSPQASTAVSAR